MSSSRMSGSVAFSKALWRSPHELPARAAAQAWPGTVCTRGSSFSESLNTQRNACSRASAVQADDSCERAVRCL